MGTANPTSCETPAQRASGNNGNVVGYLYQDSTTPSFDHTASYTYDPLNRLSAASATGSSTYSLQFLYDRWGNMTCNIHANPNGLCANVAFNTNNQIASIGGSSKVYPTYDAAGNLTYDGTNSYTWDAEGRQITVGGGRTYVYNALGQQVEWSNLSFDFVYDKDERWVYFVNEIDGSQTYSEIPFLGGRYLGSYRNDGTHLTHANLLGSTTMETNASGGVMEDLLFYPWGQFWQQTAATGWSFASLPYRDQPLGHDLTPNRIYDYGTAPGRWLSPDPLAGDVMNPQSLNRYAYALNNPTTLVDPLGLQNGSSGSATTCGHGFVVPYGQNPMTWCYNHMGIGEGSSPAAFFSNTADPFALIGVPVVSASSTWVPPQLVTVEGTLPAGGISDVEFYFEGYWSSSSTQVGTGLDLQIPGIQFTPTGPTTATFVSQYPFYRTVGKFAQAGFQAPPLDSLNRFHPGPTRSSRQQFDLLKACGNR